MNKLSAVFLCLIVLCFHGDVFAQENNYTNKTQQIKNVKSSKSKTSDKLQSVLTNAVGKTIEIYKSNDLESDEVAATLIDLRNPKNPVTANFRGEAPVYPASVVKMFYMAALFRQLEDGLVKMTPELQRGMKNMIIESGNESTGYILDVLTNTSSGAELPERDFKEWSFKRNDVNRYYQSLGYSNINVNQKTHCEDAWGIEQQFRNYKGDNRNMLTTNATARLMKEIVLGTSVTKERSQQMLDLMKRDWEKPVSNQSAQEFVSHALKPNTRLWSKEGWTSKTRHDAAYIETPDGLKFVLVIFTENHAKTLGIIPSIAKNVIKGLGEIKQ